MLRRLLVGLGMLLAIPALWVGMIARMADRVPRLDPYPAFMAGYEPKDHLRTHDEANRAFGELVAKTFPVGSDAEAAIAKIAGGGFAVATSGPDSVELVWRQAVIPCSDRYSIIIQRDAGGRVAKTSGWLQPICS
jgi:hypothetical protein